MTLGVTYPTTLDTDSTLALAVNNATTTVGSSYTTPATTLTLTDASAFPSTGGIMYVDSERGEYTGKSGNDLTGVTGLGNNHAAGKVVDLVFDAIHHNLLKDAIKALQAKVGVTGGAVAGSHVKRISDLEGAGYIASLVADTTPQLGGNLDANGQDINMGDGLIARPVLKDYSETVNALGDLAGGTDDIDLTLGNVVTATVSTSAETFTFSNPPASGTAGAFTLLLTNGGSQTVTWPSSVDWEGGTAPTLTAAGVDVLLFYTVDGGTIWHGFVGSLDSK